MRKLRMDPVLRSRACSCYRFRHVSPEPIEVMLPVAEKDTRMLPGVLWGIRKNLAHPIVKITIVGAAGGSLQRCAKHLDCDFVDETRLVAISKSSIQYVARGMDRSGWLFQQLLKIEFARTSSIRYCLACDADTVFTSRQSFVLGNRVLFHFSDELVGAYRTANTTLLGACRPHTVSFVSHHTMFDRNIVQSMVEEIERVQGKAWYDAIAALARPDEPSVFSEYELYGSYFVSKAPDRMALQYWHNVAFPPNQRWRGLTTAMIAPGLIKTVSFHSYK